ncbi:hypothetical protein SDC9_202538 [bioreactor metagenome]|uniref:Uncharacterized protein n=1 Tax=bioreactor metagenome TaxID=1076179 RepID=A0A645IVF4_9ZZZZ
MHGDRAFVDGSSRAALVIAHYQKLGAAHAGRGCRGAHLEAALAIGLPGHFCFDRALAQIDDGLQTAGSAFAAHLAQLDIGFGLHAHQ